MRIGENDQANNILYAQNVKPSEKAEEKPSGNELPPAVRNRDEYIPGAEDGESAGLYSMDYDDEGNPVINYDAPKEKASGAPDSEKADEKEKSESCTANTDKVDEEIKHLKEKLEQLEQRLRSADSEEMAKQLEKQLSAVKSELAQKDNDSYRRSRAVFS